MKLVEQQQQSELQHNKIKYEHDKLLEEHNEQKQKFEVQLSKTTNNLLQVIKNRFFRIVTTN